MSQDKRQRKKVAYKTKDERPKKFAERWKQKTPNAGKKNERHTCSPDDEEYGGRVFDITADFDLSAVTAQSRDNPVWYVQYAHARCNSLSRMITSQMPHLDISYQSLKTSKFELLKDAVLSWEYWG